jgi:alkanesulfonate monooxygenase SsuD/methylene tetrahydromethanopterin reductase-like flavin-dependent oxidoreductase (luciferase family)
MKYSIFSVCDHHLDVPRSIGQLYSQVLSEMEWAEELGYWAYYIAEHHFHEYGVVPAPPAFLGAASQRTSRLGLGVAVSVLPFHNPLLVAEEYAVVDHLSGGRLRLGVGSGYLQHEFQGFGISPDERRQRFEEALEVIVRAWRGERFSYNGVYHQVKDVRIAVTPYQKPHPPLWIAILRADRAYHVGRMGYNIMMVPYATVETIDQLGEIIAAYKKGYAEGGGRGEPDVAVALHTYISDSKEAARRESEAALHRYVVTRLYARRRTFEELDRGEVILFGDPDLVAARIRKLAALGVTHVMALMNFGALEPERVRRSMTLFAREVMPRAAATVSRP